MYVCVCVCGCLFVAQILFSYCVVIGEGTNVYDLKKFSRYSDITTLKYFLHKINNFLVFITLNN